MTLMLGFAFCSSNARGSVLSAFAAEPSLVSLPVEPSTHSSVAVREDRAAVRVCGAGAGAGFACVEAGVEADFVGAAVGFEGVEAVFVALVPAGVAGFSAAPAGCVAARTCAAICASDSVGIMLVTISAANRQLVVMRTVFERSSFFALVVCVDMVLPIPKTTGSMTLKNKCRRIECANGCGDAGSRRKRAAGMPDAATNGYTPFTR